MEPPASIDEVGGITVAEGCMPEDDCMAAAVEDGCMAEIAMDIRLCLPLSIAVPP